MNDTVIRETVTLLREEYEQLQKDSLFLDILKSAGVDNWDFYDEAIEAFLEVISSDS